MIDDASIQVSHESPLNYRLRLHARYVWQCHGPRSQACAGIRNGTGNGKDKALCASSRHAQHLAWAADMCGMSAGDDALVVDFITTVSSVLNRAADAQSVDFNE